jgi:hypothetical protein
MEIELLLPEDEAKAVVETPMTIAIAVPITFIRRPHVNVVTGPPLGGVARASLPVRFECSRSP